MTNLNIGALRSVIEVCRARFGITNGLTMKIFDIDRTNFVGKARRILSNPEASMDCQIGKAVFRWLLLSKPAKQVSERSSGLSKSAEREPLFDIVSRNLSEDVLKRHFLGSPFHPFTDAVSKDGFRSISVSDMITLCNKSRIVETYIFDVPAMENHRRKDVADRGVSPGIHLIYSSEFELISTGKHWLYFGETGPRFCNLAEILIEAKKFAIGSTTVQRSEIAFNVDDTFSLPM